MFEIKRKRIAMNLTQKQLAVQLGVEQNTVSQWESGVRVPRTELLPKIAEILGCSVDDLLGITKKTTREG